MTRSRDDGAGTQDFADDIAVVCPRCRALAHVLARTRLTCPACSLHQTRPRPRLFAADGASLERTAAPDWHGPFVQIPPGPARCSRCGNGLSPPRRVIAAGKRPVSMTGAGEVRCAGCGEASSVETLWTPLLAAAQGREPYFGTRLYLLEETGRGVVWAYNRRHAQALLDWIAADLRERGPSTGFRTMAAMLPGWMKVARNRDAVAKSLRRLIDLSA